MQDNLSGPVLTYIGEPTPWHNQNDTPVKSSYFGIVDTAGLPKNDFYLYQSQWVSAEKHPMVHLLPHWNWDNPELANRVMDEEGGSLFGPSPMLTVWN